MSDDPTIPPTEPVPAVPPTDGVPPTEALPATALGGGGVTPPPGPPGAVVPPVDPPEPWYRNRAALATVIAVGLALLFLLVSLLIWWSGDDDDDAIVIDTSSTTSTSTTAPDESTLPTASIVDVGPLPTDSTTTTTTTSTTTTTTTTTTVAPTTTTETTTAPTSTTTSIPVVSVPASPDATLLDIIEVSPDLSRLAQLIDDAGLGTALSGEEIVTIFAPSNQAIETFESAPGGAELLADPERLTELLLGHVVSGSVDAAQVLASETLTTVNDLTLEVDPEAGTVGGATVVVTDVEAANGILHVVDRVIVTR